MFYQKCFLHIVQTMRLISPLFPCYRHGWKIHSCNCPSQLLVI